MLAVNRGLTREGKWVYGDKVGVGRACWIVSQPEVSENDDMRERYHSIWGFVEVDPKTVGRSLGWKNKYDQELWEGDILESDSGYRRVIVYDLVDHWGWCFDTGAEISNAYHWRVVGNIHQHSNLLGENDNESN